VMKVKDARAKKKPEKPCWSDTALLAPLHYWIMVENCVACGAERVDAFYQSTLNGH
jgi:hypothetical protein